MIKKLQKLIDSKTESFAINCSSKEEATELLKALDNMGYCWNPNKAICNEDGEVTNTFFGKQKEIAYFFFQTFPLVYYGRKEFFKTINCEIISFSDFKNDIIPLPYEREEKITYIEIFDETAIENICSALAQTPDKIIFVGTSKTKMRKACDIYKSIIANDNEEVEFECVACQPNLKDIVKAFSKIIESENQCCFDITGGDDIYLVALGIVYEKYAEKNIQIHMFDINNKTITDCDNDGIMPFEKFPTISVAENIAIYGGTMKSTSVEDSHEVIKEDLNTMWNIMKRFSGSEWNHTSDAFKYINAHYSKNENQLDFRVPFSGSLGNFNFLRIAKSQLMREFNRAGLITNLFIGSSVMSFRFKNAFVKKCLSTAGCLLELKIYSVAFNAVKADGKTPVFNDIQTGVTMEWNTRKKNAVSTHNEIDVMLMDGLIPVFISCKNGQVTVEELYKLNSVAQNFGSRYSRKILVTNVLKVSDDTGFRQRAKDMGIKLIENIQKQSDDQILSKLINYDMNIR